MEACRANPRPVAYRGGVRSRRLSRLVSSAVIGAAAIVTLAALVAGPALAAGPPFPPPVEDQAVYDTAGALRPGTIATVEATIDAIEARTGAEVAVYTQLTPCCEEPADAERNARALMDQWGVGRRGFDDGLVILFDLHENDPCHGQVQLYAGPGFASRFLSNDERQAIYEDQMLPLLKRCDLDGALLVAMQKVDAAATPEHAAVAQLLPAPQRGAGSPDRPAPVHPAGRASRWSPGSATDATRSTSTTRRSTSRRRPLGLTPAAGAVVRDGKSSRRALTAASLDLAARGLIGFEADQTGLLGRTTELSIHTGIASTQDPVEAARLARARARPTDEATDFLLRAPAQHRRRGRAHRPQGAAQARHAM